MTFRPPGRIGQALREQLLAYELGTDHVLDFTRTAIFSSWRTNRHIYTCARYYANNCWRMCMNLAPNTSDVARPCQGGVSSDGAEIRRN